MLTDKYKIGIDWAIDSPQGKKREIEKLTRKFLDLLADKENITTSDFQGCLDVIERQALEL